MDNRFVVLWPWLASLRSYLVVAGLLAFVAAALVVGPQGGVAAGVLAAAGGLATCLVADAHRVRLALTEDHVEIRSDRGEES